jgi:hypothetical protein
MCFLEGKKQRKRVVEPEVPQSRRVFPEGVKTSRVRVAFTPRLFATLRLEAWTSGTSGKAEEMLTQVEAGQSKLSGTPNRKG